ncbi:hypothetical protein FRB95_010982 [Tulasnella sp. JGI-2019a]|nr:hypothetical protein FRB93_009664 [Tulasnella sp. JGI-2019a]KAG9024828.1 hypothetical protein FRB95_010982 [Tulasnella sp. JGI-2019a]
MTAGSRRSFTIGIVPARKNGNVLVDIWATSRDMEQVDWEKIRIAHLKTSAATVHCFIGTVAAVGRGVGFGDFANGDVVAGVMSGSWVDNLVVDNQGGSGQAPRVKTPTNVMAFIFAPLRLPKRTTGKGTCRMSALKHRTNVLFKLERISAEVAEGFGMTVPATRGGCIVV